MAHLKKAMASVVPHSLFSTVDEKLIRKDLYVAPQSTGYVHPSSRATGIHVFQAVDAKGDQPATLRLPLYYTITTLGINRAPPHQPRVQMRFTGTFRPHQKEYANQVIEAFNAQRVVGLNLRPAMGKTTMATAIACRVGLLTAVLVHNKDHVEQWAKTFADRSTAVTWSVGVGKPPVVVDVIICLYTRVAKIPEELRNLVGFVVVDEAHQFCNRTGIDSILAFEPTHALYLTATWKKTNQMHKVLELLAGPNPVLGPLTIPFKYVKVLTGCVAKRVVSGDSTDWTTLIQSLLYSESRNSLVVSLVKYLLEQDRKIIIFSSEVEHVELLHSLLQGSGVTSCDYLSGDKSSYLDSQVLVGNTQKCGTGFDEEMKCENFSGRRIDTCLLTSSFKNLELLCQVIGRTFRSDDPWVYHLVDNDPTVKRHWKECSTWYAANLGTSMGVLDLTTVV